MNPTSADAPLPPAKRVRRRPAAKLGKPKSSAGCRSPVIPFRLLSLPPELRLKIYRDCLLNPYPLLIKTKTRAYRQVVRSTPYIPSLVPPTSGVPSRSLALLRTSKLLYRETMPILYSNSIHLPSTVVMHYFLAQLGPRAKEYLTTLSLKSWGNGSRFSGGTAARLANHAAFSMLVGTVNLRRLELDCHIDLGGADRRGRGFWRAAEHWLRWLQQEKGSRAVREMLVLGDRCWDGAQVGIRCVKGSNEELAEKFFQAIEAGM